MCMFLRVLICRRLACEETKWMRGEEAAVSDQEARVPREAAAAGGCFLMSHALRLTANLSKQSDKTWKRVVTDAVFAAGSLLGRLYNGSGISQTYG